ncbi:IS30 family transposase, partial [Tamaricihabitans halophyticus]
TVLDRVDASATTVSDRYLSLDDRIAIADALVVKDSMRTIAARIGKHVSTISREVRGHSIAGRYLPHRAHRVAVADRARPKQSKLVVNTILRAAVEEGLSRKLSPEQISYRLRRDHPDDESMRVSHETIYQALYFQARGGLKREVQQALRTGRTRRKAQRREGERYQRFIDPMVMISDRPAEVEDRAVPGHWEGDLITGEQNKTAIGTLVERATRYTMLLHLPAGHDAEQVRDAIITAMKDLPAHLRGSLTWDQGAEMARHTQISVATDMQVYFCDPASPWQRGTNENTNGLLRQYFPKGTDLSVYSPADLEHVAQQLNGRPRKTLGWDTPAERLRDLITTN